MNSNFKKLAVGTVLTKNEQKNAVGGYGGGESHTSKITCSYNVNPLKRSFSLGYSCPSNPYTTCFNLHRQYYGIVSNLAVTGTSCSNIS